LQVAEPTAVSALSERLQPVEFPCGHTLFVEGEPGDRLFVIISSRSAASYRTAAAIC
jgi:CRP-like cAMP-binding protein